jgi:hypothetical protein
VAEVKQQLLHSRVHIVIALLVYVIGVGQLLLKFLPGSPPFASLNLESRACIAV